MTRPIRKLAIVGASARAAAFSALNAGFQVVAVDLFSDADLARACPATQVERYPEGLADWLATVDCDAWLYTGALENHPELLDRMSMLRPLLGNRGDALRKVRDPLALQASLANYGVAFAETRTLADGLPRDGSWLCKTYRGASGSGVWRLDGVEALELAQQRRGWFQRHIAGKSFAAIFIIDSASAALWGVTEQVLSSYCEWQYAGSIGPAELSAPVMLQLEAVGSAMHALVLRGVVGVDFVDANGTAIVIEVNPRFTASVEIVERLAGRSAIAAHVDACTNLASHRPVDLLNRTPADHSHHAKVIHYARCEVVVTAMFHAWAVTHSSLDPMHRVLADVPHAGEVVAVGRPVLTVLASGSSHADCQQQLCQRLAEVEARLYCGP